MESFSYSIELKGLEKLIAKLEGAVRESVIKRALYQGGLLLSGWSKTSRLSGPRPQYLGVISGRLRASITAAPPEHNGDEYIQKIGTNVIYAPIHEFGGYRGMRGFMPARPFLSPALQDEGNRKEILNLLTQNINEALEKA